MSKNIRVYRSFWSLIPETELLKVYTKIFDLMTTFGQKDIQFNYSDPGIKCAYFYFYFTITVYSVFLTWKKFEHHTKDWIGNIMDKKHTNYYSMKIFSLGGNTGADTLAIYLWLRMQGIQVRTLTFFLNIHNWLVEALGVKWLLFDNSGEPDFNEFKYISFDFNKDVLQENSTFKNIQADLITVVNFFNTTIIDCDRAVPQFQKLFGHLAPNGFVLFVDTSNIGYHPLVHAGAQLAGLTYIDAFKDFKVTLPQHELEDIGHDHFKLYSPQTETSVAAALWQRCLT